MKASDQRFSFNMLWCSSTGRYTKPLNKNSDCWSRDMLNFDFLEKVLGIDSSAHFVYGFSRKMFLMLYSVNWPNFIAWLASLLKILGNMCIAIVCFPGSDVINFEINLIILIKPFFYLENKKSFQGEVKRIHHHF